MRAQQLWLKRGRRPLGVAFAMALVVTQGTDLVDHVHLQAE